LQRLVDELVKFQREITLKLICHTCAEYEPVKRLGRIAVFFHVAPYTEFP